MRHDLVHFLNDRGVTIGPDHGMVGDFGNPAAAVAGECDGHRAPLVRSLQGEHDIARGATGRQADYDIARVGERFDLTRENVVVPVVVANASQRRRVDRERLAMKPRPFPEKSPRKLGSHMLRLGGAPAVAAPQHFLSGSQRRHDRIGDGFDLRAVVRRVEQPSPIGEQLVKVTPPLIVHGPIQKSSSPCDTNSPLSGTIRTIVPASSL